MSDSSCTVPARASRVFIVEDHPVMREGLELFLTKDGDLQICGSCDSIREAVPQIGDLKPDVVVADLTLKDGDGLKLIEKIHRYHPHLPILALSMHDETVYAERALRAGAMGYIMKNQPVGDIRNAIRRIHGGEIFLSVPMATRLVNMFIHMRTAQPPSIVDSLTEREFQVFKLIADDVGPTEIGKQLNLSVKTIETHREHIKEKLGLKSGAELRRFAIQWSTPPR